MTKQELRKIYKTLRSTLSNNEIEGLSQSIAEQTLILPIWDHSYYHIFLSIKEQKEVDTNYLLKILSEKNKHIVLSKSDFKTGMMAHYLLTNNTSIKKNPYNIPEPVNGPEALKEVPPNKIEVVFIPLLAFDAKGTRVGYGKGFFDRFLVLCQPETIKIGLSFFEAEDEIAEFYESDIKLDYCVTPKKIYKF